MTRNFPNICQSRLMKLFKTFAFVLLALVASPNFSVGQNSLSSSDRLFVRFASMFSGEAAIGYEHRINALLGISTAIEGGFHFFDTLGNGLNHIGPQIGFSFYTHDVDSPHQFYIGPMLSLIYGHLRGHQNALSTYSKTPHVIALRLNAIGGYRYTFSIPLTLDVGLGIDALSLVVPLNPSPNFFFSWPLPFVHFGVGYRF